MFSADSFFITPFVLRNTKVSITKLPLKQALCIGRINIRTLADIYSCPKCKGVVAEGNSYCRSCGTNFSIDEIKQMRSDPSSVVGALPWNLRDTYRCVHCLEFVCINDQYCRGCGDYICEDERKMMRAKLKELAQNNYSSLVFCMGFVLLVIAFLYVSNA